MNSTVQLHRIYRLTQELDLEVLLFNDFGREFIKKAGFSPDGFVQLALQLAHFMWVVRHRSDRPLLFFFLSTEDQHQLIILLQAPRLPRLDLRVSLSPQIPFWSSGQHQSQHERGAGMGAGNDQRWFKGGTWSP